MDRNLSKCYDTKSMQKKVCVADPARGAESADL